MWQRSTSQRRAWPPFLNTIGAARSSATDSLCLDGSQGSPLSAVLSSLLPRWRAASRTAAVLLHYGIAARPIQTLLTASPPDDVTIAPSPDLPSLQSNERFSFGLSAYLMIYSSDLFLNCYWVFATRLGLEMDILYISVNLWKKTL